MSAILSVRDLIDLPARTRRWTHWRLKALREAVGILRDDRAYSLRERLAHARTGRKPDAHATLRRHLRRDRDGRPRFELAGGRDKVYFAPDGLPADDPRLLDGTLLVLTEAYIDRPELLSDEVRVRPGDVVLDCGGNLGTSALQFAPRVGRRGRVHSFEPVFADLLRRTVDASGWGGRVNVVPEAVGDRCGTAAFVATPAGIDSRLDDGPSREGRRVTVPMTTIDAFVERQDLGRVDVIKLDVEGAERLAIEGAAETVRRFRPRWTIASYHDDAVHGDPQHPRVVAALRAMGYSVREVERRHVYAW